MKARCGRPYFSLEISELNAPKMASLSSAMNDSILYLTKDDIPGTLLAGLNPSSLKNEELWFWLRDAVSWGFPERT